MGKSSPYVHHGSGMNARIRRRRLMRALDVERSSIARTIATTMKGREGESPGGPEDHPNRHRHPQKTSTSSGTTENGTPIDLLTPGAEYDTLLIHDNIGDHTTSRNIASQPDTGSDWRQWFQDFQSQGAAPSPDLQRAEEGWNFASVLEPYEPPLYPHLTALAVFRPQVLLLALLPDSTAPPDLVALSSLPNRQA